MIKNISKWIKNKFKTVYCNECKNMSEKTDIFGNELCKAYPVTVIYNTSTKIKKGEIKIIKTHEACKKEKIFSFCFKYKKKEL